MNLSISNLSKVYNNGVKAVDQLNLETGTGMFGLLGPNGAGKSTLMRILATLQEPDEGRLFFNSINILEKPMSLRKILGYLPQEFGVYPKVSAEKLLDYFATLKGIVSRKDRKKRIGEVLEITNLYKVRQKKVSTYSGGMKQRFGIAQLLLNNPQLIIVDEPTAGLDPAERQRFLNILREISTKNIILFSTHIVDDVKDFRHELAIMNRGRILLQNTPEVAIRTLNGKIWQKTIQRDELEVAEARFKVLSSNYNPDNTLNIRIYAPDKPENGFRQTEPQLEDVYFFTLSQDNQSRLTV